MTRKLIIVLFTISALLSCAPKVKTALTKKYPALDNKEEVIVLSTLEEVPETAIEIGTVRIGDTGFSTNCGWDVVIAKAKFEARKAGGNIIKIVEHTPPNFGSTCDRITAKILKVENIHDLNIAIENRNAIVDSTWNYAKLYVYRPGGPGVLVGFDVHLGDSIIWRAKNNSKQEIIITKEGLHTLWARTESTSELPINIEFGKEYYIRFTLGMGVMVGRPQILLIDRMQGKSAYNAIKEK